MFPDWNFNLVFFYKNNLNVDGLEFGLGSFFFTPFTPWGPRPFKEGEKKEQNGVHKQVRK